jgi:hypothetical protein
MSIESRRPEVTLRPVATKVCLELDHLDCRTTSRAFLGLASMGTPSSTTFFQFTHKILISSHFPFPVPILASQMEAYSALPRYLTGLRPFSPLHPFPLPTLRAALLNGPVLLMTLSLGASPRAHRAPPFLIPEQVYPKPLLLLWMPYMDRSQEPSLMGTPTSFLVTRNST